MKATLIQYLRTIGLVALLLGCATLIAVGYEFWFKGGRFAQRLTECELMWRTGDLSGARRGLLEIYTQDNTNSDAIQLMARIEMAAGNLREAITWLRRFPEADPKPAAAARLQAAQLAMQSGLVRDTEELASDALRMDPNFAEPRRLLMRYHFILMQHPQLTAQSVELDKRGQLTQMELLMRCLAHRASWDDDEHIAWLEQCLRTDPEFATIRAALARNYSARDRNDEARSALKGSSGSSRDDWRIVLARAELEINEGRMNDALRNLSQLPRQADIGSRVWLARAKVWAEMGQEPAAQVALENVVKLDPYDPTATYMLSRLAAARRQTQDASELFERSQHLKELMGLLSRLTEASNPAYHPVEPVTVTRTKARDAFLALGFHREAEVLASLERESERRIPLQPLAAARIDALETRVEKPGESKRTVDGQTPVTAATSPSNAGGPPSGSFGFQDISQKVGLSFRYDTGNSPYKWLMETLGGGVAVLDFDRDGWDDIYLSQAGPLPIQPNKRSYSDRLLRNDAGRTAVDVSSASALNDNAYGQGCAVGDFDNDGFPDMVVCNYGELLVYFNQGDGTFSNVGQATGISSSKWSTSATFADIDRDGDLDLYVVQYLEAPFEKLEPCKHEGAYTSCRPFGYAGEPDLFWENLGDGRFANRTKEFGLTEHNGKGLGVAIADFDRSGSDSIFVANDTSPNFLFARSNESRAATYHEVAASRGIAVNSHGLTEACMGVGLGDVNGDGRFDVHVTTFQGETSTLFLSTNDGGFVDETEQAGSATTSRNRVGWGCQFLDIDCNGDLDLFVANGHLHGPPQLAQLYYNRGGGVFEEISRSSGTYFRQPWLGRSVALIDWNRDALMDLVVTYQQENTSLLRNVSRAGNRVVVSFVGVESNRDAAGTVVEAQFGNRTSHFYITRGGGYFAANSPQLHIGCGTVMHVDELRVLWPSGRRTSFRNVATGTSYLCIENMDALIPRTIEPN